MKAGRKPLFEGGATPLQEAVALLLGYGKKDKEIVDKLGVSYETIWNWRQHPFFMDLVKKYQQEFIQKAKEGGFDDIEFLNQTMIESLKEPAHRSDGLKARELLAKLRGEITGDKEEREKVLAKKLTDEQLKKILNAPVINDSNIKTNSPGGTPEEGAGKGEGEVQN